VDLKGWGYANCDVRAYIAAIDIMQNYYPERLGKALMIHVPYLFMKAWKMVQPFIDSNTKDKVLLPRGLDRSCFSISVIDLFISMDRSSSCSSTTRSWRRRCGESWTRASCRRSTVGS
jgi:hypothetical protein